MSISVVELSSHETSLLLGRKLNSVNVERTLLDDFFHLRELVLSFLLTFDHLLLQSDDALLQLCALERQLSLFFSLFIDLELKVLCPGVLLLNIILHLLLRLRYHVQIMLHALLDADQICNAPQVVINKIIQ